MSYPITQSFIPGLPKNPYRCGVGVYEGVVNHSTADTGATDENERDFEATHWNDAFVHFFVDWDSIIQVADTNYLAWGCGPQGNTRYVQIELCETTDSNQFQESYNRYVWLTAKILHDKNLGVVDGKTLVSHDWITKNLGGTTHTDPIAYLASHGVTWAQHVQNVSVAYVQMNVAANQNFLIKVLAAQLWYYDKPDWNAKKGLVKAGEVFTVVDTLWISGSKMYKLKSGNYITANPQYVQVM